MKMFINKINIKLLAAALLTALAAPSCMNLDETREGGYGYLTISGLDLDVQVEQLVPTKAGESTMDISDLIGENRPELSEVTVTPEQPQEGEPAFYTWTISDGDLRLPAGKYTLSATSGSNDFGTPYFVGSGEVTVSALATAEGTVTFTLGNSVMKVTMADGFGSHFKPSSTNPVTISDGSASIRPAMNQYVFVPSSKSLTVTVTGNSSAEVGTVFTVTATPEAKTAYDVVLSATGVTLPSISLHSSQLAWGDRIFITNAATFAGNISEANKGKVVYEAIPASSSDWTKPSVAVDGVITGLRTGTSYKVRARVGALVSDEITLTPAVTGLSSTATHTKNNSDELDGTDVTTTFTSPSTQVTNLISSWTYQLYKSDGITLLREYTDADGSVTSDGSTITASAGWPYLPQGTYKLTATATLTDNKTVSSTMEVSIDAPTFTPTVSLGNTSYTSYDKYTANQISEANNCNAETLYSPSAMIGGISANLIKNSNYTKTIIFAVDGTQKNKYEQKAMSSNTQNGSDIASLSWGSHTLTATFTFEGKSAESSKTHHITGLPHYAQPPSETLKWKMGDGEKNTWNTEYAMISTDGGRGYPDIISPEFNVPSDKMININIYPDIRRNYYWAGVSKGDLQITKIANDGSENDLYKQELAREKTMTSTLSTSLNGGTNKFRIQYCYAATGPETYIYKFNVLYANK